MAGPELPRGSELVGIDAGDFERPGELMLTIAHPANVERIVTPTRAGEESPRSPESVSQILFREPFHGVEKGEGRVYAAADSLGPDLLERMARTGKLAREGGSPLIGAVAAEPVPNRPPRNPLVFAPLRNRAGGPPVKVEAAPLPKATPLPSKPEAEEVGAAGSPPAPRAEEGPGQGEASGKAKTEFPAWLVRKDDGAGDQVAPPVQAAPPVAPVAPAKPSEPITAQRAGTRKPDVRLTVPTTGHAPWASKSTREAARRAARARQEALPSASQSVNLGVGILVAALGAAALAGALVFGHQGTVMGVREYYRWERDALEQEVRVRRAQHERGMQQQRNLRQLELEDRDLGNLSRMVEVLDERSKR